MDPEPSVTTSTPRTDVARSRVPAHKRRRSALGSDTSSVDGDLSYLDLDTGRVHLSSKQPIDKVTLATSEYDTIMTKFARLELGLSKLDKLDKLDGIESSVSTLTAKVSDFENRLKETETSNAELKESVAFMSDTYDKVLSTSNDNTSKVKTLETDLETIKDENTKLRESLSELIDIQKSLKDDLVDLKCRSMRDNLLFTNIPEQFVVEDGRRFEKTEEVLKSFLDEHMKIKGIHFERVHRIKTKKPVKIPPIVAKFSFFKDREHVRRCSNRLAGSKFGVHEQFPEEVEEKRRELYPVVRQLRKDKRKASLVKDKLYVDGRPVRPEDVRCPPPASRPPPPATTSATTPATTSTRL